MLHLSTLDTTTLELLRKLQSIPALCKTRLVGGTALALQIGHRKSIDLDFFGKIEVEKDELVIALEQIGALTVLKESPRIHIYLLNNVKIDIVDYQYSWVDDVVVKQGIRMASLNPEDYALCHNVRRQRHQFTTYVRRPRLRKKISVRQTRRGKADRPTDLRYPKTTSKAKVLSSYSPP